MRPTFKIYPQQHGNKQIVVKCFEVTKTHGTCHPHPSSHACWAFWRHLVSKTC